MWIGDIFKKVIANLITIAVFCGIVYFLVSRYVF